MWRTWAVALLVTAFHAVTASAAMLGWLLVDDGEHARARELFRAAEADSSPGLRQSARAGLPTGDSQEANRR
jgi:hypothetical protein